MIKISKKRIVLFLLFIFPLICFLILSTGQNNFTKLPIVTKNIKDVSTIDVEKSIQLEGNISIICFLGNDVDSKKGGLFNLNEKIYKTFLDYKKFQIIAIYPKEQEKAVKKLKKEIGAFTDMIKWKFLPSDANQIQTIYKSLNTDKTLENLYSNLVFLVDKNGDLRGRISKEEILFGYNMNSVSELNSKLKDDVKVLYYEYYAAFKNKNKNKADRKEVGL